jgi:hypothetical protein
VAESKRSLPGLVVMVANARSSMRLARKKCSARPVRASANVE